MDQKQQGPTPAGLSALYSPPSMPACTCTQDGAPCATCRSYDQAIRGIEAAARALPQGGNGYGV